MGQDVMEGSTLCYNLEEDFERPAEIEDLEDWPPIYELFQVLVQLYFEWQNYPGVQYFVDSYINSTLQLSQD